MREMVEDTAENPFAAPLAPVGEPGVFRFRVWPLATMLAAFCLVLVGVLVVIVLLVFWNHVWPLPRHIFRVVLRTLTLMIAGQAFASSLFWGEIRARRRPAVRVCRDGLVLNPVGFVRVQGMALPPSYVSLVRAFVSGRGESLPMVRIPWDQMVDVGVVGVRFSRSLVLPRRLVVQWKGWQAGELNQAAIPTRLIAAPAGSVHDTVRAFADDVEARETLPGWDGDASYR